MKHRGLKFLSLLLTLVMVLGMLPGMTAFAADTGTVYLKGETIDTGGIEFCISDRSNDDASSKWQNVGTEPVVSSVDVAEATITGTVGELGERSVDVKDTNTAETRIPVGVKFIRYNEDLPGVTASKKPVVLALVYGFTVTYDPGEGSFNPDAVGSTKKFIGGKLVDYEETNAASFDYQIQGYDSYLNAPEGKVFDCWKDTNDPNGTKYRAPQEVNVTANLTLTAQWKDKSSDSGSGSGNFDIVFNIPGVDNTWEYVGGYAPQQAYRVSLAPMQGGSAALGLTTGESGTALNVYPSTTVYVFPEAEQGYTLDKIVWSLIDGSASYDITEAKNFVMPAMDVVVYVTFRPVG